MENKKSLEEILKENLKDTVEAQESYSFANDVKYNHYCRIGSQGYTISIEKNNTYSKSKENLYSEKVMKIGYVISDIISNCRNQDHTWEEGLSQIKNELLSIKELEEDLDKFTNLSDYIEDKDDKNPPRN